MSLAVERLLPILSQHTLKRLATLYRLPGRQRLSWHAPCLCHKTNYLVLLLLCCTGGSRCMQSPASRCVPMVHVSCFTLYMNKTTFATPRFALLRSLLIRMQTTDHWSLFCWSRGCKPLYHSLAVAHTVLSNEVLAYIEVEARTDDIL